MIMTRDKFEFKKHKEICASFLVLCALIIYNSGNEKIGDIENDSK